jgi:protein-L-isoaspartate(D-aspartate) O-methyltransferase
MYHHETSFEEARHRMVERQLAGRGITDQRVLQAMREVPRHRFIPEDLWDMAYRDTPLPIGHDQTISQPYIVGYMTQMLHLTSDDQVLEVGTGSGYQAAILSRLAKKVHTIERVEALAQHAEQALQELGYVAEGAPLVAPIGPSGYQELVRLTKRGERTEVEHLAPVAFVPLIGEHGWREPDSSAE